MRRLLESLPHASGEPVGVVSISFLC